MGCLREHTDGAGIALAMTAHHLDANVVTMAQALVECDQLGFIGSAARLMTAGAVQLRRPAHLRRFAETGRQAFTFLGERTQTVRVARLEQFFLAFEKQFEADQQRALVAPYQRCARRAGRVKDCGHEEIPISVCRRAVD